MDDEALMVRVVEQDREAFSILVERHLDAVHAFNYRLTRNADDAADLAQETFLRVWRRAGSWRPGRVRFATWLYRIARNLCIDAHRRRRDTTPVEDATLLADGAPVEAAPAQARLQAALGRALAALPERQCTALVLCHSQGMSNAQAAQVLATSVEAVESLLARARRTLRRELEGLRSDLEQQ